MFSAVLHRMNQKEPLGITVGFALIRETNFFISLELLGDGNEFIACARYNMYDSFNPWPITLPSQFSLVLTPLCSEYECLLASSTVPYRRGFIYPMVEIIDQAGGIGNRFSAGEDDS